MKKTDREIVRQKFGGRCAYCGEHLQAKWHVDHLLPIVRDNWLHQGAAPIHGHRDVIENMMPACPPCNIDKRSLTLEDWRGIISRSGSVLERDSATFRRAMRYGLVAVNAPKIVFHFESVGEVTE